MVKLSGNVSAVNAEVLKDVGITINVTKPNTSVEGLLATTDKDGNYLVTYDPPSGNYSAVTIFAGNDVYAGSNSDVVTFHVEGKKPTMTILSVT